MLTYRVTQRNIVEYLQVAPSMIVGTVDEALKAAEQLGYPILARQGIVFVYLRKNSLKKI